MTPVTDKDLTGEFRDAAIEIAMLQVAKHMENPLDLAQALREMSLLSREKAQLVEGTRLESDWQRYAWVLARCASKIEDQAR